MMRQRRFTKESGPPGANRGRSQREIVPYRANDRSRRTAVTQRPSRSPLWPTVPAHRRKALGLHLAIRVGVIPRNRR